MITATCTDTAKERAVAGAEGDLHSPSLALVTHQRRGPKTGVQYRGHSIEATAQPCRALAARPLCLGIEAGEAPALPKRGQRTWTVEP